MFVPFVPMLGFQLAMDAQTRRSNGFYPRPQDHLPPTGSNSHQNPDPYPQHSTGAPHPRSDRTSQPTWGRDCGPVFNIPNARTSRPPANYTAPPFAQDFSRPNTQVTRPPVDYTAPPFIYRNRTESFAHPNDQAPPPYFQPPGPPSRQPTNPFDDPPPYGFPSRPPTYNNRNGFPPAPWDIPGYFECQQQRRQEEREREQRLQQERERAREHERRLDELVPERRRQKEQERKERERVQKMHERRYQENLRRDRKRRQELGAHPSHLE